MANNVIDFQKLPAEVQKQLIIIQRPAEDRFVFLRRITIFYWLAIAVAAGWLIYMFSATQDYLWQFWMFWIFAAVTLILVSIAVFCLVKIIAAKFSKLKTGCVFTADECIKTNGSRIEFWNLKELESFQFREDAKTIEFYVGERLEKIKAENADDANRLERYFNTIQSEAKEGMLANFAAPEFAYNGSKKYAAFAVGTLVTLGLAFGISYAAKRLNQNFDDEESWRRAERGIAIADFEEYKQRHPEGNHMADADRRISAILSGLKADYTKKIKGLAEENAVKTLGDVLENIGKQPNRAIYVKIKETRELDEAVIKELKEQTGLSINSYDYSVPPSNEAYRKEKVLKDLSVVFLPATKNASVKFEPSDNPPENSPVIDVNYLVKSEKNYMRYNWFSTDGSSTVNYNPMAKFIFDFSLKSPDTGSVYQTKYESEPKNLNTGLVDSRDAANYTFDKVYFGSVSESFGKFLERKFGFSE